MNSHEPTKTKTFQKNKKLTADSVTLQKQKRISHHIPVLSNEVLDTLMPQEGESYLDLTAGYGGHAKLISEITGKTNIKLVDRDENAVQALKLLFPEASISRNSFSEYLVQASQKDAKYDIIFADIGISSPHIDDPSRGFSFMNDGPLDMRMDQSRGRTAKELLEELSKAKLVDILVEYGEEYKAKSIVAAIKSSLPIQTTHQLAEVVASAKKVKKQKIHPATKTFQALRIAVNNELEELKVLLDLAPYLLKENGRLGIISFHSLEDRMVKTRFNDLGQNTLDSEFVKTTKKPIVPSDNEIVNNPRARSAKLRVLQRK